MDITILTRALFAVMFIPILGFVMTHIYTEKRSTPVKFLVTFSFLILLSAFIPLVKLKGIDYSLLTFILKGSISFTLMYIGYIVSLMLLFRNHPNSDSLSATIYFVSWIFSWFGLIKYLPNWRDNFFSVSLCMFIYIIIPMINILFYYSIISVPEGKKKRIGIWKLLDDWGTNRTLIRDIAKKLQLDIMEGSGWKQSEAKGKIDDFDVEITGISLTCETGAPLLITEAMVFCSSISLPRALVMIVDSKRIKYALSDFISGFSPNRDKEFIIFTSEGNRQLYKNFFSNLTDADSLRRLLQGKSLFAPFIIIDGNKISYNKPFPYNISPGISVDDLEKAIKILICLFQAKINI